MRTFDFVLVLMGLFIIKHLVCDWFLQSSFPYQFKNKGTYGHPGGILHAGIAAAGTLVVFLVISALSVPPNWFLAEAVEVITSPKILAILFMEFLFHYHVDWLKVNLNMVFNLNMNTDAGYWNLVGIDQTIHYLSYVAIIWFIGN